MNDPIVEEVRRIRAEIAARNGNDLRRIFEDARSRQAPTVAASSPTTRRTPGGPACVVREEPPRHP